MHTLFVVVLFAITYLSCWNGTLCFAQLVVVDPRSPLPSCQTQRIPNLTPWNAPQWSIHDVLYPTWADVGFASSQVTATAANVTLACSFNSTKTRTVCGWMDGNFRSSVGPFVRVNIDLEWPRIPVSQSYPMFTYRKISNNTYSIDSIGVGITPINVTHSRVNLYTAVGSWNRQVTPQIHALGAGRHSLLLMWDNQSIILIADGNRLEQLNRRPTDFSWPARAGDPSLYVSYRKTEVNGINTATLTGPNTTVIIYSMSSVCVAPYATDCYKQNPFPGLATCDATTGLWSINGSVISTEPLNITGVSLVVNGTVELGTEGITLDPEGQLNATAVTLGGVLTLDLSNSPRLANGTSIVLMHSDNISGSFTELTVLSPPTSSRSYCDYSAVPDYSNPQSFSVLIVRRSCRHKGVSKIVIGAVVGGVVLLAVVIVVLLLFFCRGSSLMRRRPPKSRRQMMQEGLIPNEM